jgi:hypothetical protein
MRPRKVISAVRDLIGKKRSGGGNAGNTGGGMVNTGRYGN